MDRADELHVSKIKREKQGDGKAPQASSASRLAEGVEGLMFATSSS